MVVRKQTLLESAMGGERTSALPSGKQRVDQLAVNVGDAIRLTSFEVKASVRCCQSNDNLSPLSTGKAGDAEPMRRASSTQPGLLSVGPCMSLC